MSLRSLISRLEAIGLLAEAVAIPPAGPETDLSEHLPLHLRQRGYTLQRTGKMLRLHGRLLSSMFPETQLDARLREAGRREAALANLKTLQVRQTADEVLVFSATLRLSISGGKVHAQAGRHDQKANELASLLNGEEPTPALFGLLASESAPPGAPAANAAQKRAWSETLETNRKAIIPSFADIPTMQAEMLPYLRHVLSEEKAVDGQLAETTHRSGNTTLRTFNRIPYHLIERMNELGFWIHSLRNPILNGNLQDEIAMFHGQGRTGIQGEVPVSRPKDNWYHGRKGKGTVAFVLYGIPRYVFKEDVGSEWDRWTGRRYLDPSLSATKWIDRTEAWLVPARAKFVGIITDVPKYIKQAQDLGILLSDRPALFSSNPKALVPDRLDTMATPWTEQPPKGFLYWLSPVKQYSQKNRRGFVTPKLISWLERHRATLPGFEEFGHKGAGFMVLLDHGAEFPPHDKDYRQFRLTRISAPAIRTEELPPAMRHGGGGGASAIRYSVIQSGEPFQINERSGTFHTTDKGAERLQALLQQAALPFSSRSPS